MRPELTMPCNVMPVALCQSSAFGVLLIALPLFVPPWVSRYTVRVKRGGHTRCGDCGTEFCQRCVVGTWAEHCRYADCRQVGCRDVSLTTSSNYFLVMVLCTAVSCCVGRSVSSGVQSAADGGSARAWRRAIQWIDVLSDVLLHGV